ncbi:hypothetical protein EMMF5_002054 [Cystobasidiomycetes sp. EMM_F5]
MDRAVELLADRVIELYHKRTSQDSRIIVGIAGIPGSGKSTLAFPLTELINEKLGVHLQGHVQVDAKQALAQHAPSEPNQIAIDVSLDGWHTSRADLAKFPDPEEARRRRGAAFTFDALDWVDFVTSLRQNPPPTGGIAFRTFSHSKKDPETGPFLITGHHQIIVLEGLYVLNTEPPWDKATEQLDERVWVDCPPDVARARLIERHLATGVENTREAAEKRIDGSDLRNAEYIVDNLAKPTITIESIIDLTYARAIEQRVQDTHGQ